MEFQICPNCKNESNTFGVCTSTECQSGKDKVIFCSDCYEEHLDSSHRYFKESNMEELISFGMIFKCPCGVDLTEFDGTCERCGYSPDVCICEDEK